MFKAHLSLIAVLACAACGSQFDAGGGDGAGGADASAGGAGSAGDPSSAAGATSSGGRSAGSSGASSGGAAQAGESSGGSTASAGRGSGSAGSGATDCESLKAEYAGLVKKARVCDKGSSDECSTSSSAPNVGGCGCPTLLNQKSEFTPLALEKYQELQKANCNNGPICNIACLQPTSASCDASSSSVSQEYVCTGVGPIAN